MGKPTPDAAMRVSRAEAVKSYPICGLPAIFGQEIFTSTRSGPAREIVLAISGKSSSQRPATLAITGFLNALRAGINSAYARYPRFGNPIELIEPPAKG